MTASYHRPATPTVAPTTPHRTLAYYEYIVTPPIQLVLNAIREHCSVGGTIRPGVRRLAAWANYASAGRISPMLDQLAADGWITYDPTTGLIMLLEDPYADDTVTVIEENAPPLITAGDHETDSEADSEAITVRDHETDEAADSERITRRDRDGALPDAAAGSITRRDRQAPRMEDSCLAAAGSNLDSAAVSKYIPCAAESIPERDRSPDPVDVLLAELGTSAPLRAQARAALPDLTVQQVRDTWAHFEVRIKAGRCTPGAFHAAIARGELHAAPPDPTRPLNPAAYAEQEGFALGSDPPPSQAETMHERASRLLPPVTAANIRSSGRDLQFVLRMLVSGATDAEVTAALAVRGVHA